MGWYKPPTEEPEPTLYEQELEAGVATMVRYIDEVDERVERITQMLHRTLRHARSAERRELPVFAATLGVAATSIMRSLQILDGAE